MVTPQVEELILAAEATLSPLRASVAAVRYPERSEMVAVGLRGPEGLSTVPQPLSHDPANLHQQHVRATCPRASPSFPALHLPYYNPIVASGRREILTRRHLAR